MKAKTQLVILILLIAGATEITAQQRRDHQKPENERAELNLSEEQREQMHAIKLNTQKEILPLENELGEIEARMKTLSTQEEVDLKEINKLIDDKTSAMGKMMKIRAASHQEVRALLTEEQRVQFDTRKKRMGAKKMTRHRTSFQRERNSERR